ncbi:hypothetical protein BDN72DRAFT_179690 [Pluteus cervinus]|uniref:Uncharacterized protein n=1 Tax=Pluteus cervinus TaxID=181527 RepID=A0ACD3AJ68_9AGAR|nr:hypothetical protein BDN72DRAFT_179690 [Pluteus cervinus]
METISIRTIPAQKHPFQWDVTALRKYGTHTRNLFIWTSLHNYKDPLVPLYLSLCPNVTNVLLWSDLTDPQLEQLARLPLTDLSISFSEVYSKPNLFPLFSKITHLEALINVESESQFTLFENFTSITHLMVSTQSNLSILPRLFKKLPTLRVLIMMVGQHRPAIGVVGHYDPNEDDPRIVKMVPNLDDRSDDWLVRIRKGRDIWTLADEAVRERQKLNGSLQRSATD